MAGERINGDNGGNGEHAQKAVGKAVLEDETDGVLIYPLPSAWKMIHPYVKRIKRVARM